MGDRLKLIKKNFLGNNDLCKGHDLNSRDESTQ